MSSSRQSPTSSSCTLAPCPPTSPKPDASTTADETPAAAASASASGSPFAPTSMSARSTGSPISRQLVTAGRPCTMPPLRFTRWSGPWKPSFSKLTNAPADQPERSDAPTIATLFGARKRAQPLDAQRVRRLG